MSMEPYKDEEQPNKRRYLMNGTPFASYQELATLIGKLAPKGTTTTPATVVARRGKRPRSTGVSSSNKLRFPSELVHKIASYFTVRKLDPTKTRAVGCSSSSNQYDLEECLNENDSTWWISAIGSFRQGKGEEYVEFELDPTNTVRLSTIWISIPMLPTGPLSVRTMRLDGRSSPIIPNNDAMPAVWLPLTETLTVANRNGFQRIDLGTPIDAQHIRLVCLTNQASVLVNPYYLETAAAVGFFTVKFE